LAETYKQSFWQDSSDHLDLCVFNGGRESCAPGHTWGPGLRDHYLIHLVLRGCGSYKTGGKEYQLGAGDLFLLRPGQLASYTASQQDPWEYSWVGFNGAFANKLMRSTPFTEQEPVYHSPDPAPLQTALLAIFAAQGSEPQNEAARVGHLYLFLSGLMGQAREADPHGGAGAQYVASAIRYIQYNYSHEVSIDDIAKAVGVSRSHLYRLFMSHVGQSPIDYLTGYRIDEACNLLKNSQLSIAEIAMSVGFFDKFYFSRVFKKAKGVPPSRYLASLEAPSV